MLGPGYSSIMTAQVAPGTVRVGLSGWSYSNFRGKFYPKDVPSGKWLGYLATQMPTVEINSSFYRLQRQSTYAKWEAMVPETFLFSVKGWRMVTHMRKLNNVSGDVAQFLQTCVPVLGASMGPVLWQLPPSLKFDEETLETFLSELPKTHGEAAQIAKEIGVKSNQGSSDASPEDTQTPSLLPAEAGRAPSAGVDPAMPLRYALEPRNQTFADPQVATILNRYGVAMVQSDSAGRYPSFDQVTTDFVYVRLHGSPRMYYSNYSNKALEEWASKITTWRAEGRDCFVYFDNTAAAYAPANALALTKMVNGEQPAN